jgi:ubiquitin carboxyl-terminal hydrolase 4/11/15
MLYAAVCSGSYASFLDLRLVNKLCFQDHVTEIDDNRRVIKLPMYLPEAVPVSASSHSSSPAPQLPSLTVEFIVIENQNDQTDSKAIQIFLGSDMLRAHNADVLLSSNQLTLYDDDRSKLRIPLVRPEDEHTFKSLYITSGSHNNTQRQLEVEKPTPLPLNLSNALTVERASRSAAAPAKPTGSTTTSGSEDGSVGRQSLERRPLLGLSTSSRPETKDAHESSPGAAAARACSSPAIWSNWRRDTEKTGSTDWANAGKTPAPTYQRRDTGIKVLKKPGARTLSTSIPQVSSPSVSSQSRFFDDGKRREDVPDEGEGSVPPLKRSVSGEKPKENTPALTKNRPTNPVGGASAFPWLNTGGAK